MRPKGAVFDKRVRAVTQAASELFSTQGFLETSMDDIARAAHLSKGGMYHYFKSKTEILFAILSDFMDQVLAISRPSSRPSRAPIVGFRSWFGGTWRFTPVICPRRACC